MAFYGIPIHIMRDLFMTLRSFFKRVNDFRQYRNATRDMNSRYPDATAEELERENTCIVCREEMRPWVEPGAAGAQPGRRVDERQRPKKLPCGHILHFSCLRSWLERQQVCPTCRRPVLSNSTQNNQQANQNNQAQRNPQNPQALPGFGGAQNNRNEAPNNQQPAQPNALGAQPQPGNNHGVGGDNQQNRPAGNMRVYNFGPIRIALGRLALPQGNANAIDNNVVANLAQQAIQNPVQAQGQPQVNPNNVSLSTLPALLNTPITNALPQHPSDIQSDILRLQHNIIESVRQLNHQHAQLEYLHALLAELRRLQEASGITTANGQELPIIAPLNPLSTFAPVVPQAYFSNGPVLRQGDAGLPEGIVLPEGWTLRPMAPAPAAGSEQSALPLRHTSPGISGASGASSHPVESSATLPPSSTPGQPDISTARPQSSGAPSGSSVADSSTSKQAEASSSLESSWSFGNVAGTNEAEGSSSAVAQSAQDGQNVTRRTATVEDDEDQGE